MINGTLDVTSVVLSSILDEWLKKNLSSLGDIELKNTEIVVEFDGRQVVCGVDKIHGATFYYDAVPKVTIKEGA